MNTRPGILAGDAPPRPVDTRGRLVLTGELGVHELRYLVFPEHVPDHGSCPPSRWLSVVALACGAGQLVATLEGAAPTGRDDRVAVVLPHGLAGAGVAIAGLFGVQETGVESLLAGGGAGALTAAVGGGGWVALPLALGVAALMALALTGLRAAVRAAARAPVPRCGAGASGAGPRGTPRPGPPAARCG